MTELVIDNAIAERLRQIVEQENRSIENVLASILDLYTRQVEPLKAMDGMFDDDVTDLSTSVRETISSDHKLIE